MGTGTKSIWFNENDFFSKSNKMANQISIIKTLFSAPISDFSDG